MLEADRTGVMSQPLRPGNWRWTKCPVLGSGSGHLPYVKVTGGRICGWVTPMRLFLEGDPLAPAAGGPGSLAPCSNPWAKNSAGVTPVIRERGTPALPVESKSDREQFLELLRSSSGKQGFTGCGPCPANWLGSGRHYSGPPGAPAGPGCHLHDRT